MARKQICLSCFVEAPEWGELEHTQECKDLTLLNQYRATLLRAEEACERAWWVNR